MNVWKTTICSSFWDGFLGCETWNLVSLACISRPATYLWSLQPNENPMRGTENHPRNLPTKSKKHFSRSIFQHPKQNVGFVWCIPFPAGKAQEPIWEYFNIAHHFFGSCKVSQQCTKLLVLRFHHLGSPLMNEHDTLPETNIAPKKWWLEC